MCFIWPVGLEQEGKALNLINGGVVGLKVWNASQVAVDYFRILKSVRVQLTVYISLRETRNMALSGVAVCTRKVMESEKCGRKGSAQLKMVFLQFPMVQLTDLQQSSIC